MLILAARKLLVTLGPQGVSGDNLNKIRLFAVLCGCLISCVHWQCPRRRQLLITFIFMGYVLRRDLS